MKLTKLEQLLKNRDRYRNFASQKAPIGASAKEWMAWHLWVQARRSAFHREIVKAREEKRNNQRSKADDRRKH